MIFGVNPIRSAVLLVAVCLMCVEAMAQAPAKENKLTKLPGSGP